ncbi:RluA family pseudouridine synthase [Geminisphaera colitermitum]|uniref:RluA family pseudouridine synthase n=1 Tax=Geminisphaera colitermitum TaxID=1148786 RepID=UPI000694F8D9|nr:RluA family pseudouridine synthase [Geminisphaera colitermitum]
MSASNSSRYRVPDAIRRERADKVLAAAFPELSRVAWQRSFDAGLVRRAGRVLDKKDEVRAGEVLEFSHPETKPSELRAADIPLEILHEDEHLLVVNKAAGMVVHPGAGTGDDTLVHALLGYCASTGGGGGEGRSGLSGVGGVERPGIVHRLDRETTGVIVVAKTDAAHRGLSEQFAGRHLHKEYVALVAGVPRLASGTIDRAIARHPVHRHRMTTGEGGRPSRTDWVVLEAFPPWAALVRCHIHTGRTHQIRVHMKSIGHVLLGDATYGWKPDPRLEALDAMPRRVMLHAEHIRFQHPVTGRELVVRAPLPEDFEEMLRALRAGDV